MSMSFAIGVGIVVLFVLALLRLQSVPISEQRVRVQQIANELITPINAVGFAASTSSPVVTIAAGTANIPVGALVIDLTTSSNLVNPAYVISKTSTSITLNHNVNAVFSDNLQFFSVTGGSAQIHLFQAPYAGGPDPAVSYFTTIEATFDTYAAQDIVQETPAYTTGTGGGEIALGQYNWTLSATPTVPNQIYGYWVDYLPYTGATTRTVSFWESFGSALNMTQAGNAITLGLPLDQPSPGSAVLY